MGTIIVVAILSLNMVFVVEILLRMFKRELALLHASIDSKDFKLVHAPHIDWIRNLVNGNGTSHIWYKAIKVGEEKYITIPGLPILLPVAAVIGAIVASTIPVQIITMLVLVLQISLYLSDYVGRTTYSAVLHSMENEIQEEKEKNMVLEAELAMEKGMEQIDALIDKVLEKEGIQTVKDFAKLRGVNKDKEE